MQPPVFKLCGFLLAVFLTMAEDLLKRNGPYRPYVLGSLPRDTAHNQKVSQDIYSHLGMMLLYRRKQSATRIILRIYFMKVIW